MKRIVILLLMVALCGCGEKEPKRTPMGTLLLKREHCISYLYKKEWTSIQEEDYYDYSFSKGYLISTELSHCGDDYMWITKNQEYPIWRAAQKVGKYSLFDDSPKKDIPIKALYILKGNDKIVLRVARKETHRAYVIGKDFMDRNIWIPKTPTLDWIGLGDMIWEDGDRVKEGKLCE